MNCPVCDSIIEKSTSLITDGLIGETSEHCDNCGYYYEFAYGTTREIIDGEEFVYGYGGIGSALTEDAARAALEKFRLTYKLKNVKI